MENGQFFQGVEDIFHQAEREERLGNKENAEKLYTQVINEMTQNGNGCECNSDTSDVQWYERFITMKKKLYCNVQK